MTDSDNLDPERPLPSTAQSVPVQPGTIYGHRYRMDELLVSRGNSLTWRAYDSKLSRSVLVHLLAPHDPRTPQVLDAARRAAGITDARFLRVLDAVVDGPGLVVSEFVPGQSLQQILRAGPLSPQEAAWVVREVADALAGTHRAGMFHLRLSPDTIVITPTGNVKIVGFLIESALNPDPRLDVGTWSHHEHVDVSDLGRLLYAGLVGLWPSNPALPDGPTWDLQPAPITGSSVATPRELSTAIPPALDTVCDQLLNRAPRHSQPRITSADQLTGALTRTLGNLDASAELERRLRYPVNPIKVSTRDAVDAARQAIGDAGPWQPVASDARPGFADTSELGATAQWDPFADTGSPLPQPADSHSPGEDQDRRDADEASHAETPSEPEQEHDEDGSGTGMVVRQGGVSSPEAMRDIAEPKHSNRPTTDRDRTSVVAHRLMLLFIGLALVSLLIGGAGLLYHARSGSPAPASTPSPSGRATLGIKDARDFDPTKDGGNGVENPSQVKLAYDGNPATAWRTVVYLNSAKLGKLKPGVGLVLDLGASQHVGAVKLTLVGAPTTVQLRVPKDAGVTTPPMTTVGDWREVASGTATTTTITLSANTDTRYLLVYLTSLPQVSPKHYQAGIADVEVES